MRQEQRRGRDCETENQKGGQMNEKKNEIGGVSTERLGYIRIAAREGRGDGWHTQRMAHAEECTRREGPSSQIFSVQFQALSI